MWNRIRREEGPLAAAAHGVSWQQVTPLRTEVTNQRSEVTNQVGDAPVVDGARR